KRRERLGRLFAASTPQALQWRVHQRLLAGPPNSKAALTIRDKEGNVRDVVLIRSQAFVQTKRTTPGFPVLPSGFRYIDLARSLPPGFGYIDLTRLTVSEVDRALETVKETPGLIFDMRGYPQGTAWALAPRLTSKKVIAARFQRPELHSPDLEWASVVQGYQT